jgi:hypothetical protein
VAESSGILYRYQLSNHLLYCSLCGFRVGLLGMMVQTYPKIFSAWGWYKFLIEYREIDDFLYINLWYSDVLRLQFKIVAHTQLRC